MTLKEIDPKVVLHNLCNDMEIPIVDEPDRNLTRVQLTTRTKVVNTAFRFDADGRGFQHSTPLVKISKEDAGKFAELAIRNPPREVTPVLSPTGIGGIQGAKSPLPQKKAEMEGTFLDVFGRVANYTDNDLPKIMSALGKKK